MTEREELRKYAALTGQAAPVAWQTRVKPTGSKHWGDWHFGRMTASREGWDFEERRLYSAPSQAPVAPVAVKALRWEEHWGGSNDDIPSWHGINPLGLHVDVCFVGKYKLERHSDAPPFELAAAKAGAQADYETRILSAITWGDRG